METDVVNQTDQVFNIVSIISISIANNNNLDSRVTLPGNYQVWRPYKLKTPQMTDCVNKIIRAFWSLTYG